MIQRRELKGHEPCGCGSGHKYRACCRVKGHQCFVEGGTDPTAVRSIPLTERSRDALLAQKAKREAELGRPLRPDDKVFGPGDIPDTDKEYADQLRAAGLAPEFCYAVEKTGLLIVAENRDKFPAHELEEWENAVREYREQHPDEATE